MSDENNDNNNVNDSDSVNDTAVDSEKVEAPKPESNAAPSNDNSSDVNKRLAELETNLAAMPEKFADVVKEMMPKPAPKPTPTPKPRTESRESSANSTPGKKTFTEWWFGK